MKTLFWLVSSLCCLSLLANASDSGAGAVNLPPSYHWILHDKIRGAYLAISDPPTLAPQLKETGMNCVIPKMSGFSFPLTPDRIKSLRAWGNAAQKTGLHVLPAFDFKGSRDLSGPRRFMTEDGYLRPLTPCPLDEAYWHKNVRDRMVELATNASSFGIEGVNLDVEMYGADDTTYRGLCYCDDCFREFLQSEGLAVTTPLPDPAKRFGWLNDHGLAGRFRQKFTARIGQFCSEIERDVHQHNPEFLIGVLQLDQRLPFYEAIAAGLGTPTHPMLCFSEKTYESGFTPFIEAQQRVFTNMPAHVLFVAGLWIRQFPSDHLAEHCYYSATDCAGYWIWTFDSLVRDMTSPVYALRGSKEAYWQALQTANSELDQFARADGHYASALKVRPFEKPLPVLLPSEAVLPVLVSPANVPAALPENETVPELRRTSTLYISADGEAVRLNISNFRLIPAYTDATHYAVIDPQGKQLREGIIGLNESNTITWQAAQNGVYVVIADSGQNTHFFRLLTGQKSAYKATEQQSLRVHNSLGQMFFYVPAAVRGFSLFAKAQSQHPGRGGKLGVCAPDGELVKTVSGDLGAVTELSVRVAPSQAGQVWKIRGDDISNDLILYFGTNMPGYLSTSPSKVLVPAGTAQ